MGSLRVTQNIIVQRTLSSLSNQTRRLLALQEQISTGQRVNRPSDDPVDARRGVNLRLLIGQNEQFIQNISDISSQLNETTTTLQQVVDNLQRARELTLQGASGTNSRAQLDGIAEEIDQLLEGILVAGNHQTNGRYIFGGSRTLSDAFDVTRNVGGEITAVTYAGDSERIDVSISEGIVVPYNEPGSSVFQGTTDIYRTLIDIRDNLRSGNQAALQTSRIAELDEGLEQVLRGQARLGAIQNRLERVSANTEDFIVQLRGVLSDKIDADVSETFVEFNVQTNVFNAALNAASRVIQPSLLDFLR